MNCNLKRFGGLLTTLLVTSSFGFADSGEKQSNNRQNSNYKKNASSDSEGIYWEGKDEGQGADALATRCFQNCFPMCPDSTWSIEVDFLWWSASYHPPYALKSFSPTHFTGEEGESGCGCTVTESDVTQINSHLEYQPNKWNPGYRVGLGWDTQFDGWDTKLVYTYYHDSSSSHTRGEAIDIFWSRGSAHSTLNYNVGDWELGRTYYVSRYFVMRPFVGIRTAWLDQHFEARANNLNGLGSGINSAVAGFSSLVTYFFAGSGVTVPTVTGIIPEQIKAKIDMDVWGIGPRFGVDTNWGNWHGLSLLANISTALLYGQTWTRGSLFLYTDDFDGDGDNDILLLRNKNGWWHGIPMLQTQFGLTWASACWGCTPCVPCGQKPPETPQNQLFRIFAAWESNYWWDSNEFTDWDYRAVSLQGLTVGVKYDF